MWTFSLWCWRHCRPVVRWHRGTFSPQILVRTWILFDFQLMHGVSIRSRLGWLVGMWTVAGIPAMCIGFFDVRKISVTMYIHFFEVRKISVLANFMRRRLQLVAASDILARLLLNPAPTPHLKPGKPGMLWNVSYSSTKISRMHSACSKPP